LHLTASLTGTPWGAFLILCVGEITGVQRRLGHA